MKKLLFLPLFFVLILFSFKTPVFAQELRHDSNEVRTRVGNPAETDFGIPAPAIDPTSLRQALINEFGVTMNDFGTQHMQWTWELLWGFSNTEYNKLIRGAVINALPGSSGGSYQQPANGVCKTVFVRQYVPAESFKLILTHELGHTIEACTPRELIHWADHEIAYDTEGGISEYGRRANQGCQSGVNKYNENFADMLAYFLNPTAGDVPPTCHGVINSPDWNPFYGTRHKTYPMHEEVVRAVLGV